MKQFDLQKVKMVVTEPDHFVEESDDFSSSKVSCFNDIFSFLKERECSSDCILRFKQLYDVVLPLLGVQHNVHVCHESRVLSMDEAVECATTTCDVADFGRPANRFSLRIGFNGNVHFNVYDNYIDVDLTTFKLQNTRKYGFEVCDWTKSYSWDSALHNDADLRKIVAHSIHFIDGLTMLRRFLDRNPKYTMV